MNIRMATELDLPAVLEITNDVILTSSAIYEYEQWTESRVQEWYQNRKSNGFPILVLEVEGVIAGFASYSSFRHRIGYRFTVEHSVYIHKNSQGLGYGSVLLQELIDLAKKNKLHTMIGVVDATNKGSIMFHKKLGFEEVGRFREVGYKFDKWLDVIFLQKMLKP